VKDFPSATSYWRFAHSVRTQRRYLLRPTARRFLQAIRATAERRLDVIPADGLFWRAQRGCDFVDIPIDGTDDFVSEPTPYKPNRMKPPAGLATEGRANPKGIPYLYLASQRDTAAAEVRPWKCAYVSVGQFRAVRDLRIVNTTLYSKHVIYLHKQVDPLKREEAVWGDIDRAFAVPTTPADNESEYVPTQVLAELFKEAGFDGVGYRSSYGGGHNVALFDLALAEQVNCVVLRVSELRFTFELEEQFGYDV
jgi:hypothetical protein